MLEYLVLLSIPLAAYGSGVYLIDTITGKAKPNKVSWIMWSVAQLIAVFAAVSKGVTWAILPVFMAAFGTTCISVASFFSKKGYWKLTFFDYVCGFLSVLALILWAITKEGNIAIIFAIAGDIFASIPTLKKAWTNPETETAMPYAVGLVSALTTLAAIKYWIFPEYAFGAYLFLMDSWFSFSICRHKIFRNKFLSAGENKV